jgi:hypothetical protein
MLCISREVSTSGRICNFLLQQQQQQHKDRQHKDDDDDDDDSLLLLLLLLACELITMDMGKFSWVRVEFWGPNAI